MKVHPPHGPIHSIKEFLVHLLAITIGLLIALGLEASVEWVHHRRLVREARENIFQEIRDNERNVAEELNALPAEKSYLRKTLIPSVNRCPGDRPSLSKISTGRLPVLMLQAGRLRFPPEP